MTSHDILLLLIVSSIIVLVGIVLLLLFKLKPKKIVRKHIIPKDQNGAHNKTTPGAWYSPEGDCIFCFVEDVDDYAEYINRSITVYKAEEDNRITGFQIKEIDKMMNQESDTNNIPDLPIRL